MKEEFKKIVKAKFGTLRRFAQSSGYSETYLYNAIRRNNPVQIERLIVEAGFAQDLGQADTISDSVRESIRQAIKTRYGSQKRFCLECPEFSEMLVSRVVNGQTRRMSKKVKELIELLGV